MFLTLNFELATLNLSDDLKVRPLCDRPALLGRERIRDRDLKSVLAGLERVKAYARRRHEVLHVGLRAGVELVQSPFVDLLAVAEEAHLRLQARAARRLVNFGVVDVEEV